MKLFREQILKFLPLLLLYVFLVILFSSEILQVDEGAYVRIANRLAGLNSPGDPVYLWFGPGYPLVLTPFVLLNIPWLWATLLNAVFLFGAVVYLYKTLTLWVPVKYATIIAYVFGLYPPSMRQIGLMHTEIFTLFLICGFMYHFCMVLRESNRKWFNLLISSGFLGYLALTKVLFGYVIVVGLISFVVLYIWRRSEYYKWTTTIFLLAILLCLPYLFFTYSVTGKIFYWGTSGGDLLYWTSTPFDNELGSWFHWKSVQRYSYLEPHRDFFDSISGLSDVERDEEFKKQAVYNISHYPKKFIINLSANIGRLLFSYPFSYTEQKLSTYFYIIPNMFIVVLFVLGIYPVIIRWRSIPFEIYALFYFNLVTFGGTTLFSAVNRYFVPMVPFLFLWLSFIYFRLLEIKLR